MQRGLPSFKVTSASRRAEYQYLHPWCHVCRGCPVRDASARISETVVFKTRGCKVISRVDYPHRLFEHANSSGLNHFASDPAHWVMARLLKMRSLFSAAAVRGNAVEHLAWPEPAQLLV